MTPDILLNELEKFFTERLQDVKCPVKTKDGEPQYRGLKNFKQTVPSKTTQAENAPYLLLQVVKGEDRRENRDGKSGLMSSTCDIRIVAVAYNEDESEGSLQILDLITRIRIELEKTVIIGEKFQLEMPLEYLIYTDETAPYYVAEMMTTWQIPTVEWEISCT